MSYRERFQQKYNQIKGNINNEEIENSISTWLIAFNNAWWDNKGTLRVNILKAVVRNKNWDPYAKVWYWGSNSQIADPIDCIRTSNKI